MKRFLSSYPDLLGITASSLCLVHCMLTPVLFISTAVFALPIPDHSQDIPLFWKGIELFFLALSFWSVQQVVKQKPPRWLSGLFFVMWFILVGLVLLEWAHLHVLGDYPKYATGLALIGLHLFHHLSYPPRSTCPPLKTHETLTNTRPSGHRFFGIGQDDLCQSPDSKSPARANSGHRK
jgi:hypothetical protein